MQNLTITDARSCATSGLPEAVKKLLCNSEDAINITKQIFLADAPGKKVFLLAWEGHEYPRGVVIEGETIAEVRGNNVIAEGRRKMGTCYYQYKYGGESNTWHLMTLFYSPPSSR